MGEWNSHGGKDRGYIWAQQHELLLKKSNLVLLPLNTQLICSRDQLCMALFLEETYWPLGGKLAILVQQFILTAIDTYPGKSLSFLLAKPQPAALSVGCGNS